jgi:hypothetical protein
MKEIAEPEARELAARYLTERYRGIEIVLTAVRELDIGWLVAYQSKAYLDSGDDTNALLGNGPLVIDRAGGIHSTGTSLPTSEYVDEIRNKLKK